MNNFFKLKYLLLFAFTAAVFSSCQNESVTTEPQNTDSNLNVKKELDALFKDYTLVELDTDGLFNQMVSANGEIKTLKLDIPNIPIQDFELINDNDVFSDPSFDDQEFYYMKSTENKNPNDISWFSFYRNTPMHGSVIVREDDSEGNQKNTIYLIEGVESYLDLNEDYDRKYKNLYVVYNNEDTIVKDSAGCGLKGTPTELPRDIDKEALKNNTENRGPWIGVIPLHYYVGQHYTNAFRWGNKWQRARAEANTRFYATRHYFLKEQRAGIDLRPSVQNGYFTSDSFNFTTDGVLWNRLRKHFVTRPPHNPGSKRLVSLLFNTNRDHHIWGLAYLSGVCDYNYKFNIVRRHNLNHREFVSVWAHEIGHNMGLRHTNNRNNLMFANNLRYSQHWFYNWQRSAMKTVHDRNCR